MVRIALEKELQVLKNILLDMAKAVDEMVNGAILAVERLDPPLGEKIVKFDDEIDYYEHLVTKTALEIIALQQPVAKDLRFVISAISIARNLERLADQGVNIAERVPILYKNKDLLIPKCKVNLFEMAKEALYMVESAINAFVTEDTKKAYEVIAYDDIVDKFKDDYMEQVKECMMHNVESIEVGLEYIIIIQNLERIADLATNIAEEVIFTVQGKMPKVEAKGVEFREELRGIVFRELPVFELLKKHANLVLECVERLPLALEAYFNGNKNHLEEITKHIIEIEKEADKLKRNIREHLPKGLLLPVEKFELFLYLKEQDSIVDAGEELLHWLSFRDFSFDSYLKSQIMKLLNKSLEAVRPLVKMIELSASFLITRDEDAHENSKEIIREIRYKQHLTEEFGYFLKKDIFKTIQEPVSLFYTLKLVDIILGISHYGENAADLMRAMIAK